MNAAQDHCLISLLGTISASKLCFEPLDVLFDVVLYNLDPLNDDLFKDLLSLGRRQLVILRVIESIEEISIHLVLEDSLVTKNVLHDGLLRTIPQA